MKRTFVVAVTGASGMPYAIRLIEVLLSAGCDLHLVISQAAMAVLRAEMGVSIDPGGFRPEMLGLTVAGLPGTWRLHASGDLGAPIASGSFRTDGMVVCPCSCGTLGAIVHGSGDSLIERAAEVHLKERRRLVLVPRETPLSWVQLDNMKRAVEAGAVVLPAMPAFYHGAATVADLVDFVVSRICDQLCVENALIRRWGVSSESRE